MVEHSAVNRNVGGSNPPRGAKIFVLNKLESLGRAFGFRPNARDVKCKWVARKLLNGKAFPEYVSKEITDCGQASVEEPTLIFSMSWKKKEHSADYRMVSTNYF